MVEEGNLRTPICCAGSKRGELGGGAVPENQTQASKKNGQTSYGMQEYCEGETRKRWGDAMRRDRGRTGEKKDN